MKFTTQPINFMKIYPIYFAISFIILLPGMYSLITHGLRPAIDFTGGSLIEFEFTSANPEIQEIRNALPQEIEAASIQTTSNQSYIMRTKPIDKDQNELIKTALTEEFGPVTEARFETIGPTLGKELLSKTTIGIILSASAILFYMAYRFKKFTFGVAALVAMLHDSLVIIGIFSLLGYYYSVEVDTLFVTAMLTVLSFSVHDTIVVFDRIRESRRNFPKASLYDLVNKAVNETLTRSINNSMTIIFMLLALWLMGGETTKWFVFALLVGVITGTYSSPFTAAPLLLVFEKITKSKKR